MKLILQQLRQGHWGSASAWQVDSVLGKGKSNWAGSCPPIPPLLLFSPFCLLLNPLLVLGCSKNGSSDFLLSPLQLPSVGLLSAEELCTFKNYSAC